MVRPLPPARQGGVVLLEGLIAILIFSLGVLAMIWMQASATRQVTDSKFRIDASFAANKALAELWGDPNNLKAHETADQVLDNLPQGRRSITVVGNQVTVTITWRMPGESKAHSYQAVAVINA